MLLLRAKSGPPKTTVKGNTVVVDRHISGNLEETRTIQGRRLRGKQNVNVTRRIPQKTAMMPVEDIQHVLDYHERKHKQELQGAHELSNRLADKMREEFLRAHKKVDEDCVNQIGRVHAITAEAKRTREQLRETIQVAKSAQRQLKAAKKTIEEKAQEEEELREKIRARVGSKTESEAENEAQAIIVACRKSGARYSKSKGARYSESEIRAAKSERSHYSGDGP